MKEILKYYWCIKVDKKISPDKEIYLYSDSVENIDGDLIFKNSKDLIVFSISRGLWHVLFAASCLDGHAVAVEHWKNEIQK